MNILATALHTGRVHKWERNMHVLGVNTHIPTGQWYGTALSASTGHVPNTTFIISKIEKNDNERASCRRSRRV
jgi:hypothetical protein